MKQALEIENRGQRAVFLDRDGTINIEKEYLYRPDEFEFIPGAQEAIRTLRDAGFLVVVITNQSGVARGYYDEASVEALHKHMDALLEAEDTDVNAYYFCPHHPEKGIGRYLADCSCRKPFPGMLLQAASDLGINLSESWMIGDKLADVQAGHSAGCKTALVLTGYGTECKDDLPEGVPFFDDLLAAARAITHFQPNTILPPVST